MLANDLGAVAQDIRDFLETGAAPEELRRERVPEAMRVRTGYSRFLKDRPEAAIDMRLVRLFGADAVPEEIPRFRVAQRGRCAVQRRLQIRRHRQKDRLPALFRAEEYSPAVAIPADAVTRQQRHVADAEGGIAKGQHNRARPQPLIG